MKQHITLEQLNELDDVAMRKLAEYKGLEEFDKTTMEVWRKSDNKWETVHLLLSIGQMIEFLEKHTTDYDFNIRIHSAGSGWKKPGQRLVDIYGLPVSEIEDEDNLCDALWEAVKSILEK